MKVLIVGSGGREHALAWQCARFDEVKKVFVAPGNAGTHLEQKLENINLTKTDELIDFAQKEHIDITIVGPEAPLVDGIVDEFNTHNLAIFGPSAYTAQLEGSKAFSKDFMAKHNIPTAFYEVFTDKNKAIDYVKEKGCPIVIKADGLAAGKGVIIAENLAQAEATITDMLSGNAFGEAGSRVVIEEFLAGEEASFIVMSDGKNILPMATSQDHKARDNGDIGPNTGGMGAYSPAPIVDDNIFTIAMDEVIRPTIDAMADNGTPYVGFLYAGLMIKGESVKVLEFNCRFGDPETQPIMMRLQTNLAELCLLATQGKLGDAKVAWSEKAALGVVLASDGYPYDFNKGQVIELPQNTTQDTMQNEKNAKIFHAGTQFKGGDLVNSGGRVLCATALGDDIKTAQKNAYDLVKQVKWDGAYYRTDIGFKAID
jgi:phosphoribosylamine--glycine ligase